MFILKYITLIVGTVVQCEDFHCKARSGCDLGAKCAPSSLDSALDQGRNEFPIICKGVKETKPPEDYYGVLMKMYAGSMEKISSLEKKIGKNAKIDTKKLLKRVQTSEEKIDKLERLLKKKTVNISSHTMGEPEAEMTKLRREMKKSQANLLKLEKMLNDTHLALSTEISDLKRRVAKLEPTIRNPTEISDLKRRVAELEPTIRNPTEENTISPTTTMPSAIHKGPVTDLCKRICTSDCFWVELLPFSGPKSESYYTYAEAEKLCKDYDSVLAIIRDEQTYDAVLENARTKADALQYNGFNMWIANQIVNPTTGDGEPRDAFYKWFPGLPPTRPSYSRITIYGKANEPKSENQGMFDRRPDEAYPGVVCQRTCLRKESSTIYKGPVTDSCKTGWTGGCFWVEVTPFDGPESESYYTYAEAEKFCEYYNSVLAIIPDEKTYNAVVQNSRPKAAVGSYAKYNMWIAMQITNSKTGEFYPQDAFYKWFPGYPRYLPGYTNTAIHVKNDPDNEDQGMHNETPTTATTYPGVVCWKPHRSL